MYGFFVFCFFLCAHILSPFISIVRLKFAWDCPFGYSDRRTELELEGSRHKGSNHREKHTPPWRRFSAAAGVMASCCSTAATRGEKYAREREGGV